MMTCRHCRRPLKAGDSFAVVELASSGHAVLCLLCLMKVAKMEKEPGELIQ